MATTSPPIVTIESGSLSGTFLSNNTTAFLGVPYAAPPVGDLRWRPPQPLLPWEGLRQAGNFSASCIQTAPPATSLYYDPDHQTTSEDCLYVNVWTSDGAKARNRPVLVWFHWGAFTQGSGSNAMHHGAKLAAKGITVVTANYRLGRFGELALKELSAESGHGASGNYGIMDQIAVLEWVKRNIKAFGGDPDNVTVGGASAGGASTSVLRISPFAKGLFAKAICESGPGLAPVVDGPGSIAVYTTLSAAEKVGAELIGVLNVTSLEELRKLPADSIRTASLPSTVGDWVSYLRPNATGLNTYDTSYPIVDGYVIPESPLTAFQTGNITDVPLLAGNPLNDGTALPHLDTLAKYDAFLNEMFGDQATDAKRVYPATTDAEAYNSSWALLVDQVFVYPTWTAARLQAKTLESPSWYYRFDRAPPIPSNSSILEKDFAGAFHTAGALYAFGNLESRPWDWTSGDWELSEDLMDSYVRFMTTGNPDVAAAQNGTDSWLPLKTGGDLIRSFDVGGGGVERQLASVNEMSAFWDGFYGIGM